ncbi:flagellar hook-basal body complex protein [Pelosinus sp. IPA-1]|uniref:flagellar hook-basal body complex protein n=1 Tax=Pelosinus sp. IPA-1 TaxID=3029569 RepID=UPI00243627E4|nr:flagellar hook-basal body complex protein [Pelosinus sp. IPA-1]GMA99757.1 hypothetical protein PIPA1_25570 [Pelosinus sp. IPA-1]
MMRSLYAAISGLRNHQTKMDVIGNNIANVNTVGFKSGSVTFQDMLSQTLSGASSGSGNTGGTNAMQVGLGVSVASINTNFSDGSTQSTGVQTDLAITGQGFFVVGDALNQQYTRSGNFTFDALGNFVNGNGVKVLGWQGNSSGVVDTTGPIGGITVPVGSSMPAKVSSTLSVVGNLSASANPYGTAAQRIAAANTLATANTNKTAADAAALAATNQSNTDAAASTAAAAASSAATQAKVDATNVSSLIGIAQTAANALSGAGLTAANAAAAQTAANNAVTAATAAVLSATAAVTNATAATLASATLAKNDAIAAKNDALALQAAANALSGAGLTAANATAAQSAATTAVLSSGTAATDAGTAATTASTAASNAAATAANSAALSATANVTAKAAADAVTAATDAVKAANDKSSDQPASLNVYDTQGNAYKLSGTFEKTGANVWTFTPAATVTNGNGAVVANVTTSAPITLAFDALGKLQTNPAATITINPAGGPYSGAGAFTITPDFSTMTQYGTDTTAKMDSSDGYTAGTLTAGGGITIASDGTIVGTFTNGKKMNLGQVAMATFNNPGGLLKSGDSLYTSSSNSGQAQVGKAGTGGRGTLTPGSLEMSNVDLAQQFSDMIVTQRGFQANSKIITTDDSMLEELVNLKR